MNRIDRMDRVEMFVVRIPLVKSFQTSFSIQTHREALLLKIVSGDAYGWGECVSAADPYYSYETNTTASHIIRDFLIPLLRTMHNFSVEEALGSFERIRGHNMAKAAVENALLDLLARKRGVPLFRLIGGNLKKIMSGISIGIQERSDELLALIQEAVDKKYGRIKIKIKKGKDIDVVRAVREVFPDILLMADANADYSLEDADRLKRLDAFQLMMIEQPLNYEDIYFHSLLQKKLKTPLCLDESIKSLDDAKTAVSLKSCRIINIKQGRVGGIVKAKRIAEFCRENQIKVWSGGMLETGIGRAFNIHLQTLPGFVLPGDTSETSRYFKEDIVDRAVVLTPDGSIPIPEGAGIGVDVVPERLKKYRVHYERL